CARDAYDWYFDVW
nr:immunoglobulin heavy chain junction region [Mus musculus]MBK4185461.1 immunoglobulin heavy chain junction region [Mus musculus]MBK4185462.1 immunoglobulin heavy chain junction region [Mus musculus]